MSDEKENKEASKKVLVLQIGGSPGLANLAACFQSLTGLPMIDVMERRLEGESEQAILNDITRNIKREVNG